MGILPAISGNKGTFKKGGEKAKKVMNCLGNGSGFLAQGKGKKIRPAPQAASQTTIKNLIPNGPAVKGSAKGVES